MTLLYYRCRSMSTHKQLFRLRHIPVVIHVAKVERPDVATVRDQIARLKTRFPLLITGLVRRMDARVVRTWWKRLQDGMVVPIRYSVLSLELASRSLRRHDLAQRRPVVGDVIAQYPLGLGLADQ